METNAICAGDAPYYAPSKLEKEVYGLKTAIVQVQCGLGIVDGMPIEIESMEGIMEIDVKIRVRTGMSQKSDQVHRPPELTFEGLQGTMQ